MTAPCLPSHRLFAQADEAERDATALEERAAIERKRAADLRDEGDEALRAELAASAKPLLPIGDPCASGHHDWIDGCTSIRECSRCGDTDDMHEEEMYAARQR